MRLQQEGLVKIGEWSENFFIKKKALQIEQLPTGPLLSGATLKVISKFYLKY